MVRVVIRLVLSVLLLAAAWAAASANAQDDGDFRNLGAIEDALDPLQFANHDGVRHYGIDLSIAFAFNSDQLLPESTPQIEALGQALSGERLAAHRFVVIGHTDSKGTAAYNLDLSLRRANTVRNALIQNYAIDPARLDVEGKGFSQPKPNLPPTAAANRRVEVRTLMPVEQPAAEEDEPPAPNKDVPIDW